jgi:hypothetical protein
MADLNTEIRAFERMRPMLEAQHMGRWVVIHDGELIGDFGDFEEAADHALKAFGRGPYLIRQVGAQPSILPVSVVYAWPNAQG